MSISVRLGEDLERRLAELAAKTGRSKAYYVREAVEEHIEDLEDIYLAEQALERLRRGEDQVMSADEFWRGLAD